jgi:Protein of unknown function (DUF2852)
MGLLFLILGLVWWFPIGLFVLAAFLVIRAMGYWHRPQFAGAGAFPPSGWGAGRWESRMLERTPSRGPGNWRQPSSGNRAFDEYRAETLRRLEDEQREFKEFLGRLRVAKDRAELDQFLNERRNKLRLEGPQS